MRTHKLWCVFLVLWIESEVISAKTTKKYPGTSPEFLEENAATTQLEEEIFKNFATTENFIELSTDGLKFEETKNVTPSALEENSDVEADTAIGPTTEKISKVVTEATSENTLEHEEIAETSENSVEFLFSSATEDELSELNKKVQLSYGCPVDHARPCVPKCCNLNESHTNFNIARENRTECVPSKDDFWLTFADCPLSGENTTISLEERYEYYIGIPCTNGK